MKEGKNFINKNKFDDIKRMDRRQMNEYINGVRKAEYEKGYAAGLKEAETRINSTAEIDFDTLEKNLTQVSGIGRVRALRTQGTSVLSASPGQGIRCTF